MLRSGAIAIRLCRYSGANARPPRSLTTSAETFNTSFIRRLTRELNTLPQPKGVYHCPMDDGKAILIEAGYRDLKPQHVVVGLSGCGWVTNGWTDVGGPSPQLARVVQLLEELVGR